MIELSGDRIVSFGWLFEAYMSNHARLHCRRWKDQDRMFRLYLTDWAAMPAESIKRFDVQRRHADLGERIGKTTANRVTQLLKTVYNRGIEWELVSVNPARGIRLFRLAPRDRFLEAEEIERFARAVDTLRYQTTRDFLWMCALTAVRRSAVSAMRWDQISFERNTWHIPAEMQKNGQAQILPLTDWAMEILLRRRLYARDEWVFPSDRSASGHLTKPEAAWKAVIERSGLQNVRIHDLRRTLASHQAITGANISVIAQTLNHKDLKSTAIYARLQIDPVRRAMEKATRSMFNRPNE